MEGQTYCGRSLLAVVVDVISKPQTFGEDMHITKWNMGTLAVLAMATVLTMNAQRKDNTMTHPVFYRTVTINGLAIFYREAGPKDAPTILLLHGLPSSSRMFQPLLTRLSGQFHIVAPDYPGFGHSDAPTPKVFAYTFDHLATVMDHF